LFIKDDVIRTEHLRLYALKYSVLQDVLCQNRHKSISVWLIVNEHAD